MKNYGAFKKSELKIQDTQYVFRKAKKGYLKIEQWVMDEMNDLTSYYGYDDGASMQRKEAAFSRIIEEVYAENFEFAQELINIFTESKIASLNAKQLNKLNRSIIIPRRWR